MIVYNKADCSNAVSICGVKGNSHLIKISDDLTAPATWAVIFKNTDGNPVKNVGSVKRKDELKPGETNGDRSAGIAETFYIESIEKIAEDRQIPQEVKFLWDLSIIKLMWKLASKLFI